MKIKPISITLAFIMLIACYAGERYEQADSKLTKFYADMLQSDFSLARLSIDGAINRWPWNSRYYTWRGYLSGRELPLRCPNGPHGAMSTQSPLDRQQLRRALADYSRALDLNSRDAVAYHNQAWLEHLSGDDEKAARDWREATLLDPLNAVFHVSYGLFLQEKDQSKQGTVEFEAAIELSPSILDSPFFQQYRERSSELAQLVVARSISMMEGDLRKRPDAILEARLGKLYQFSGNYERAQELLSDASQKLPNLAVVWINLGDVRAGLGYTQAAIDCYRKANVIDGQSPGPYLRMAEIYLRKGQTQLASRYFDRALEYVGRPVLFTAAHNNRLYVGPRQEINDLLPTTLAEYLTPCDIFEAIQRLAHLLPSIDAFHRAPSGVCQQTASPHAWP